MQLSAFNLYVEHYPSAGETLVHNTYTGGFAVLDAEALAALRAADGGAPSSEAAAELLADPELRDPDVGIVVPSLDAEAAEYRAWFEARKRGPGMTVILGINLACNFDCPYCCQAEVMSGEVMGHEHVEHSARWIAEHALDAGLETIHVAFVGGEPLLHPDRIETLARRVRALVADSRIEVTLGLITNGYFLDEAMVDRLVAVGLVNAQVTFDGDDTTHHLTRVSKKGENTFRRIFDNVVAASRKIRIAISGNYQTDTIHGFGGLIEMLGEHLPAGTRTSFSPALQALASSKGTGSGACSISGSPHGYMVALHDAALSRGLDPGDLGSVGPCGFHDHHTFAIGQDGTIFQCPGFLGFPEWGIGHVAAGLDSSRQARFLAADTQAGCGSCAHRPKCAGGCVAASWLERGEIDGNNCELPYFEAVTRHAVPRAFVQATAENSAAAARAFPAPPVALPRQASGRGIRPAALNVINI